MCSQSQTLRVYADLSRLLALQPADRCLVVVPFFHTFGYKGAALSCLMAGATVVPEAVFDVDRVLATVASRAHQRAAGAAHAFPVHPQPPRP